MPGTADHPFTGPPVEPIPLTPPPLARVLAQVRFSPVLAVSDEAFAGQVQQQLFDEYPFARSDIEIGVMLAPGAEAPTPHQTRLWRFQDTAETLRVTLATGFVALETTDYVGHEDFFGRLERVLTVIAEFVRPPQVERTGVRYIQRLTEAEDLAHLADYVRPEVAGTCAIHDEGTEITLCLTQTQAVMDDTHLTARWGILPPAAGVDPAIEPVDAPTWVMDIDVFDERREPFDAAALAQRALEHSRRQYRFFRWAVEPAFLLRFGADEALVATVSQEVVT
ncbi:MAG: TIGR04255 family protein [Gaiellales bacterium]